MEPGFYNMDCLDGMREMDDESIDLTVTSPPYDNLRDYHGYMFDYKATLEQLFRVTKIGGVVVWIVNDQTVNGSETGTSFRQALYAMECGFNLHDTMIWHKSGFGFPDSNRYYPIFEYMFVFSKGIPATANLIADRRNIHGNTKIHGTSRQPDGSLKRSNGDKKRDIPAYGRRFNVWQINEEKANRTGHPAVFPVRLAIDHILSWSNEGDLVLDPFTGSGTTGIAAHRTNRRFMGFEIDPVYYKAAKERLDRETAQVNIMDLMR